MRYMGPENFHILPDITFCDLISFLNFFLIVFSWKSMKDEDQMSVNKFLDILFFTNDKPSFQRDGTFKIFYSLTCDLWQKIIFWLWFFTSASHKDNFIISKKSYCKGKKENKYLSNGAFKNYVHHFLSYFDHLPTSGWHVY